MRPAERSVTERTERENAAPRRMRRFSVCLRTALPASRRLNANQIAFIFFSARIYVISNELSPDPHGERRRSNFVSPRRSHEERNPADVLSSIRASRAAGINSCDACCDRARRARGAGANFFNSLELRQRKERRRAAEMGRNNSRIKRQCIKTGGAHTGVP